MHNFTSLDSFISLSHAIDNLSQLANQNPAFVVACGGGGGGGRGVLRLFQAGRLFGHQDAYSNYKHETCFGVRASNLKSTR